MVLTHVSIYNQTLLEKGTVHYGHCRLVWNLFCHKAWSYINVKRYETVHYVYKIVIKPCKLKERPVINKKLMPSKVTTLIIIIIIIFL